MILIKTYFKQNIQKRGKGHEVVWARKVRIWEDSGDKKEYEQIYHVTPK